MAFTPVKLGSIVIRDPEQLKIAFPDKQVYTALMEYFPATKGPPQIQSMSEDTVQTLIRGFQQRIQGLSSISASRMSKINGYKNTQSITELVHLIALLRQRNLLPSKPVAKKLRKKIETLPNDKKRELIFKLLWDLLHPTTDREEVGRAWDTILEEILTKEPYKLALQTPSTEPLTGAVDLEALTAGDEAAGRSRFAKTTAASPPAEQLKKVYAISQLFDFTFDSVKSPALEPLLQKLSEILNAYTAFYSKRFPSLLTKTGFLTTFYKDLDKKLFNVDTLATLYKSITTIQKSNSLYPTVLESSVLIKVSGFDKNIQKLIAKYSEAVIGKGGTKTNQIVRDESINSDLRKLYSINVLDTHVVQIIAGARTTYKINAVPDSYGDEEKELLAKNKDQIAAQASSYFGDSAESTLYLVITPSKLVERAPSTEPAIQRLFTYTPEGTLAEGIIALQQDNTKKTVVSLIAPNKASYIDVKYTPVQVYQSFTLPILQLLLLTHLKAQIASP